jgi:hypothetical protein
MIPKIKKVEFGNIQINDNIFDKEDFILFWDSFKAAEKNHSPTLDEFHDILLREPEIVIFGTGFSGCAKISDAIKKEAEKHKIVLIIDKTPEALKRFQEFAKSGRKIAARIHTTC